MEIHWNSLNSFNSSLIYNFRYLRYERNDPGHALYLLFEATGGQAHKLISNCVTLPPKKGLSETFNLLHKTFGSPQVAVRSFIESVCNGSPIVTQKWDYKIFILI